MAQAIRFHATGGPEQLVLDTVDVPAPAAGEARVRHAAIGVNYIDTYHRGGLYPLPLPSGLGTEAAGVVTAVGFNYLKNPMLKLAKEIIDSGEIGQVRSFNGIHAEDYMADAQASWTWRLDPAGGGGALADLGSHVVAKARYLVGPIAQVLGDVKTVITERPEASGSKTRRKVEVEDIGRAFVRFENGATGCIQANWIETGRKMQHDFAISGSKGGIAFSQEI